MSDPHYPSATPLEGPSTALAGGSLMFAGEVHPHPSIGRHADLRRRALARRMTRWFEAQRAAVDNWDLDHGR